MASIDKRPDGRWRARWRTRPGGPQSSRHFRLKIEATRFLATVEADLARGVFVDPNEGNVTFAEYADKYLASAVWRSATAFAVSRSLGPTGHARRALGDRPVNGIRQADVQAMIAGLDLAPSTVGLVHQHVVGLFEAAVDASLIARNPARGVKLPDPAKPQVVPLTRAQVAKVYDVAHPWLKIAVVIGAGLGLRQAEASGLTADRIDWTGGQVRVDRQWSSRHNEPGFKAPKSKAAFRSIPASPIVLDALRVHLGGEDASGQFVVHRDGEPVGHNAFEQAWRTTRRRAGLEDTARFHDLRHAFASALISSGCSVRAVQHALGHASAATTLGTYSHLWPGDEDRIRAAVSLVLGPAED